MKNNTAVLKEFVKILDRYMSTYGLYTQDISILANSSRDILRDLGNSNIGLSLKTLESVAQVFGLRYYEFGNPDFRMPKTEDLPQKTLYKIRWRKRVGSPEMNTYNKIGLNEKVRAILVKMDDTKQFLPSEVFKLLPESIQEEIRTPNRITGLLTDEFVDYVSKTGEVRKIEGKKGRPEHYYRIVKSFKDFVPVRKKRS